MQLGMQGLQLESGETKKRGSHYKQITFSPNEGFKRIGMFERSVLELFYFSTTLHNVQWMKISLHYLHYLVVSLKKKF